MNNIKFRAWLLHEKRMITHEQDFIPLKVCSLGILRLDPCSVENKYSIVESKVGNEYVLMPSTGQFDVNKVEIFVGDIVKIKIKGYPTPEIGVIEYFDDYCMYSIQEPKRIYQKWVKRPIGKNGSSTKYTPFQWAYSFKSVEVIGNKFENPELCSNE
jgi:uncharacterized phage protein (TIGR01671 family)